MALLVAALAVATSAQKMDGEVALDRAGRVLQRLGFAGPFEPTELAGPQPRPRRNRWGVGLKGPRGQYFLHLDPQTGAVVLFSANHPPSGKRPPDRNFPLSEFQRALKLLGYKQPVRADGSIGFGHSDTLATLKVLVNGLIFFNVNPSYGHSVSLDSATGRLNSFVVADPIPPVAHPRPQISAAVALSKLREWERAEIASGRIPKHTLSNGGELRVELGYWKIQHENKARLVWRGSRFSTIQGKRYGLGPLRRLVDAHTGQTFKPVDAAWGTER